MNPKGPIEMGNLQTDLNLSPLPDLTVNLSPSLLLRGPRTIAVERISIRSPLHTNGMNAVLHRWTVSLEEHALVIAGTVAGPGDDERILAGESKSWSPATAVSASRGIPNSL